MSDFKLRNPYHAECEKGEVSRITVDVSSKDYNLIKSIRPYSHTISGTAGWLWQKLCNELRKRGITDFSKQAEFEQFIESFVVIDGGEYQQLLVDAAGRGGLQHGTATGNDTQSGEHDGRRGKATRVRAKSKDV